MKMYEIKKYLTSKKEAVGAGDLTGFVVQLALIAIIGAIVLIILAALQTSSQVCLNACTGGGANILQNNAYNGIGYGVTGINTILSYLPLIALVIVAAVIITIVILAFAFRGGQGRGGEL